MCGICVVIKKSCGALVETNLHTKGCKRDPEASEWREFLSNRGPDLSGNCHLSICGCEETNNVINAEFCGYVLHLRGVPTTQPLTDAAGNILLWNGEIFGGSINVEEHQNDCEELLRRLSNISNDCNDIDLVNVFLQIHGPWAFVYFQKKQKKLWFGRDFFGRRSLLWHLPESISEPFVVTSAAVMNSKIEFKEVPAKMVYNINIEQLNAFWSDADDISNGNKANFEPYLTAHPLSIPKSDIKADILTSKDVAFLCSEESRLLAGVNPADETTTQAYKQLKEKIRSSDGFAVSATYQNNTVPHRFCERYLDDRPLEGCSKKDFSIETEPKRAEFVISQILNSGDANLYLSKDGLTTDKAELESKEIEPPEGDSEIYKELLDYYASYFLSFLETSTMRRVFNLPRGDTINCKLNGKDVCAKNKPVDHQVCHSCPSFAIPKTAKVGILFSGGIDSMVLAAVADRCVPRNEAIDLLNVAFEQQPARNNTKPRHNRTDTDPGKDPFDVPDRITGRAGIKELSQSRTWNFVEINVTLSDVKAAREKHVRHLVYPLQTVLDDSLGCAIWFAARGLGTKYTYENGELVGVMEPYTSNTKVLLAGMGADEQLGGYARHRGKFEKFGWKGLREEIEMELQRISSRNLGRDDRCISDHGREARFPFLDENLVTFLQEVPVWIKCDPRLRRGYGEKRLLREVARRLDLHGCATLPKRAIQFGSRIAKMENSKEKGSDSCTRLKTNDE